ncbi:NAD(P)-dependent oxidoreductase [Curtobacterium sp. MCPF17_011]|uniref:SDR family oxidoreductase n=1 Tax=Curtobacterium sp. MCPF17_011 TaxID=2175652 RepID=UPI000DAA703F|nr:SDR family oxidoreductase [Curtobacterium sp. MCPF17_011]PZF09985.1 NAD(P)-dependent oxidoreductase [Curtobacterium sp. MCPF17_011]
MTIAIFGATGKLGGDVLNFLTERGVPARDVLALGRNADRLAELEGQGFQTAQIDLDQPEGLADTLRGVDTVLLISTGDPGQRLPQHVNAVDAAKAAGVKHLVYTSALEAPTTILIIAGEHKATEEYITASGIPATFLRMGWYTENHVQDFEAARTRGVIANSIGDGRISSATRRDLAEGAAVVLSTEGHEGKAYELSGDVAWTYTEFAAAAAEVLGTPVRYDALTSEQEREQLLAAGLDEGTAGFVTLLNANMRDGAMAATTGDLSRLIGHPTEPLATTLTTWR